MRLGAREPNRQHVSFSDYAIVAGIASPGPLRATGGVKYRPCVATWKILTEEGAGRNKDVTRKTQTPETHAGLHHGSEGRQRPAVISRNRQRALLTDGITAVGIEQLSELVGSRIGRNVEISGGKGPIAKTAIVSCVEIGDESLSGPGSAGGVPRQIDAHGIGPHEP